MFGVSQECVIIIINYITIIEKCQALYDQSWWGGQFLDLTDLCTILLPFVVAFQPLWWPIS